MKGNQIEFTIGDTKSNQQTASKTDVTITINNNNNKNGKNNEPDVTIKERNINLDESQEFFPSNNQQNVTHQRPRCCKNKSSSVPIPPFDQIQICGIDRNGFLIALCKELTTLLTRNDLVLIHNILDRSGLIIFPFASLAVIHETLLPEGYIVKISYALETDSKCCGLKTTINPIKNVSKIIIKHNESGAEYDFQMTQNLLYNYLISEYKICLTAVI